jgi:cysteinyl-tRNA synthetase
VYRFAAFQTHYRKPMEYSAASVEAARNGFNHLQNQVRRLGEDAAETGAVRSEFRAKFFEAVNDDLNMPRAMAVVQEMLKSESSSADKLATILDFDRVLGLDLHRIDQGQALPEDVRRLADERRKARAEKNWALSDRLRDEIQNLGYVVQDTKDGMTVFKQ